MSADITDKPIFAGRSIQHFRKIQNRSGLRFNRSSNGTPFGIGLHYKRSGMIQRNRIVRQRQAGNQPDRISRGSKRDITNGFILRPDFRHIHSYPGVAVVPSPGNKSILPIFRLPEISAVCLRIQKNFTLTSILITKTDHPKFPLPQRFPAFCVEQIQICPF